METTNTKYEDENVMLDNDDASCTTGESGRVRLNCYKTINQMGRWLIDMCRSLNLHMLKGRYGVDNEIGKPTCKNSSTVDYVIISEKVKLYLTLISWNLMVLYLIFTVQFMLLLNQYRRYWHTLKLKILKQLICVKTLNTSGMPISLMYIKQI